MRRDQLICPQPGGKGESNKRQTGTREFSHVGGECLRFRPSKLMTLGTDMSGLARPLMFETFIQYNLPVYPGAQGESYESP